MKIMNINEMENAALQLKSLLSVLAIVDGYNNDNSSILTDMPTALKPLVELAENLYCSIVEMGREVK
jgi:hypothetical protein